MERIANVLRHKRTGAIIVSPMGTFRGYGGYVEIPQDREVSAETPADKLGISVLEALAASKATGQHIEDAKAYLESHRDAESRRIRDEYGLVPGGTTRGIARQFDRLEVTYVDGQKSWSLELLVFQRDRDVMAGDAAVVRVQVSAGPEALGVAIRETLNGLSDGKLGAVATKGNVRAKRGGSRRVRR